MTTTNESIARNVKWSAVSQASRLGAQLLGLVILARLLPAADFGLVAMATVVTGFASLFRDFGTAAAVIQKQNISDCLLDSVFWFNVIIGSSLTVILIVGSTVIAWGFGEAKLVPVLGVLAWVFIINSLGAIHQALLERALRFKSLAVLDAITSVAGLGVAIVTALSGWGVYSLVSQTMSVAMISTAGLWVLSRWRPRARMDRQEIHALMGFSANLFGFNISNYFVRNADNILIGRFLGAADLGYYTMAYRLMLWPLHNISSVLGRVLFPKFSRIQNEKSQISDTYVRVTSAVVLLTAPLMFGLFVLREPFVELVLGERWHTVANLLFWLAPVGFLQSIGTLVGPLYTATGRTDVMFKWGLSAGVLAIVVFVIGLQWGVEGVAAAYFVFTMLLFWPNLAIPFKFVGLRVITLVYLILPSIITAFVMALVVYVAASEWPHSFMTPLGHLLSLVGLGIATYLLLSMAVQKPLLKSVANALFHR